LTIVFLHPNPMDNTCWLYQQAHFSTWFTTLSIDLPGNGRSPRAEAGLSMTDVAQASWEAVDQANTGPAILVGCSAGASVAMYMAVQRPDNTRALILSGQSYNVVKEFATRVIQRYERDGLSYRYDHALDDFAPAFRPTELGQYFAQLVVEQNERVHQPTIVELYRANGQPDPESLYAGIQAPTSSNNSCAAP
jgi:pimeloyl-ACP methyl ester carboxylesterase